MYHIYYPGIQPEILGRPSPGKEQSVVLFQLQILERSIEHKIVPRFFRIGLVTFKIMNRCPYGVSRSLVRADHIHRHPRHQ